MKRFSLLQWHVLLGTLGVSAILAFMVVFVNIPWEWNMFMDDILYNSWMPKITSISDALREEISTYWSLGRFYPVKYLGNLIKWHYLPNDPFAFRWFNLAVFSVAVAIGARIARPAAWLFLFLLGSAFLHKPILEVISLNPLGELWVLLFLSIGAFLFSRQEQSWIFSILARVSFLLMAMAKEPAAMIFLATFLAQAFLVWKGEATEKKKHLFFAFIDLVIFALFSAISITALKTGVFTKDAYYHDVQVFRYIHDFFYSGARYALWISPVVFVLLFTFAKAKTSWLRALKSNEAATAILLAAFSGGYFLFMSMYGIIAYQQAPAAMAFFLCSGILLKHAFASSIWLETSRVRLVAFVALFCMSYWISVSRWERFVLGYVVPTRMVMNILHSGQPRTIFIPIGEVSMHIKAMVKERELPINVFEVNQDLQKNLATARGDILLLDFPVYMGGLPQSTYDAFLPFIGRWRVQEKTKNYHLFWGVKR